MQAIYTVVAANRVKCILNGLKLDTIIEDLICRGVGMNDLKRLSTEFMSQSWGRGKHFREHGDRILLVVMVSQSETAGFVKPLVHFCRGRTHLPGLIRYTSSRALYSRASPPTIYSTPPLYPPGAQ